ncbi:efflux RND transporter periplasmic adaptor subunit [Vulgatibacter sp.]|uniref:efflux RND transporter periplasmic adaptor subunit n=1 Tax=Vulgatibacter sp. TaxID=1971226 RepID=UPI003566E85B
MKRRIVIAVLLAAAVAGSAWLVGRAEAKVGAEATSGAAAVPEIPVEEVAVRTLAERVQLTGTLAAVESVDLRSQVSGYVESISVPEGGVVKRGQLLFSLDARPFQASLHRARAELAQARERLALAERQAERAESLAADRVISQSRFDDIAATRGDARAQVDAARAALAAAELELGYTRIASPIDGRVGEALVRPGNLVSGGTDGATLLTTIVSIDPIHVQFDVDEPTYLRLAAARHEEVEVEVEIAGAQTITRYARLDFLGNRIDPSSGTARARAVLANSDGALSPGLFARVRVPTSAPAPTPLVSDRAVASDQGGRYVLVVDEQNVVRHRAVQLGAMEDGKRVVRDGLTPGEKVVVGGRVRPGMTVRPRLPADSDAPLAGGTP